MERAQKAPMDENKGSRHREKNEKKRQKRTIFIGESSNQEKAENVSTKEETFPLFGEQSGANGYLELLEPQDADYAYLPPINDEIALLILARVPRSEFQKLSFVNRRYQSLVQSGLLYAVRREMGLQQPYVFMLASGEPNWWLYDPSTGSRRTLPLLPSDLCFSAFDKETICAGNQLLVSGMEIRGSAIWRYELTLDRWFKGPLMIGPRCLFASASCGSVSCVAGGVIAGACIAPGIEVLNTAEKYDPETKCWSPLPRMNKKRKLCSGCYLDGKFYVLGGVGDKGENLTCAEFYDPEKETWEAIPDIMKGVPALSSRSPPLVAVAGNRLYWLEASSNQVKVYLKQSNTWKDMGTSPVRADHNRGWGVAFKSLGDELLVIGGASESSSCMPRAMTIYSCRPDPRSGLLRWRVLASKFDQWSSFIFNCAIMVA